MASISIFTFEHDAPRVSSPWSTPPLKAQPKHVTPQASATNQPEIDSSITASNVATVDYSTITKLEAEPQEGSTEYKLHLLLRRRRSFSRTSTARHIAGSGRHTESPHPSSVSRSVSEAGLLPRTPTPLAATQSRQHRLEQLTTQLFWRLQQSCPHHISSSSPLVIPQFPDEEKLSVPAIPRRLIPGLEESRGALYEIGVADDGSFVGLAEDEMEESLNNLRAMAASLGCSVDVIRKVQVGECEWFEHGGSSAAPHTETMLSKLWVVEAWVHPQHDHSGVKETKKESTSGNGNFAADGSYDSGAMESQNTTQQLRVSLTGATMSGKSSLLGSLSTSTLDNGRGKSRLSLFKHRHEIASGMTSSVTQELIGYRDVIAAGGSRDSARVINYGSGDVSEWLDIHASAEGGRLVFLSDSAGHPRYRRTTVRGLVGWDPHWTLLCISADNTEDSALKSLEVLGPTATDVDLSQTHLQLCLNLELPMVVVITKYDLATKSGLRQTLSKLLSAIKDVGRKPVIVSTAPEPASEADLNTVSAEEFLRVGPIVKTLEASPLSVVPIILTSAVKGLGIATLHGFLRELPVPSNPQPTADAPRTMFHVEDVYSKMLAPAKGPSLASASSERLVVLGGLVRYGVLRIGDELLLGPYPVDTSSDDSDSGSGRATPSNAPISRSFPGALRKGQPSLAAGLSTNDKHEEWRRVRITSLRNLRLPVRALHADQAGTVGVAPIDLPIATPAVVRIRKGMVLADGEPRANRVITVRFTGPTAEVVRNLSVGSGVVVYVASVRASAKVVSVAAETENQETDKIETSGNNDDEDAAFGFGFDGDDDVAGSPGGIAVTSATVATFQFIASREFVEMDAKVLVLPGGGPGIYGGTERGEKGVAALEGYVGRVVEAY